MKTYSLRFVLAAFAALLLAGISGDLQAQQEPASDPRLNDSPLQLQLAPGQQLGGEEEAVQQRVQVGNLNIQAARTKAKSEPATLDRLAERLKVAAPVKHANLTVMLIEGPDQMDTSNVLTLEEALQKKGLMEVEETGNVNELVVRNLDPERTVFIMAGDIVKGGKQDRTLAVDLPLRKGADGGANAGAAGIAGVAAVAAGQRGAGAALGVPISAFCVEHGRWQARTGNSVANFDSSMNTIASKEQKIAVRSAKDQGKVWTSVANVQTKISGNVGKTVNADLSPTSLQLSLEDKDLKKQTGAYLDVFKPVVGKDDKAIGFVLVINGQINSAEIFASHDLFTRVWPKLAEASAIEAVSELKGKAKKDATEQEAMEFLAKAEDATATQEQIHESYWSVSAGSEDLLLFQTIDRAKDNLWLRRSILHK